MPSEASTRKRSVMRTTGSWVALTRVMTLDLDLKESTVLREILSAQLKQLGIESARTYTHDYRELLHERTRLVEKVLRKLPE